MARRAGSRLTAVVVVKRDTSKSPQYILKAYPIRLELLPPEGITMGDERIRRRPSEEPPSLFRFWSNPSTSPYSAREPHSLWTHWTHSIESLCAETESSRNTWVTKIRETRDAHVEARATGSPFVTEVLCDGILLEGDGMEDVYLLGKDTVATCSVSFSMLFFCCEG